MTCLKNRWQQRRNWQRKIILRNWRRPLMRRWRNQKRQHTCVNVSNSGGNGVVTIPGNWQRQRLQNNDSATTTEASADRRRVRGIIGNDRRGKGSTRDLRDLRQGWRKRRRKMNPNISTRTTTALTEDRRRAKEISDNYGSGRGSTEVLMYWQWQRSVYFLCYQITNSNNVLSLSCCSLVFILFSLYTFFFVCCNKDYQYCNNVENIFVLSVHYPWVCTPYVQYSKKTTSCHDQ